MYAVNPVDFDFTFSLTGKSIVPPSQLANALTDAALLNAAKAAARVVIVVGALAENHPQAATLRAAARQFAETTGAALCRIPQGANSIGLTQHGVLPTGRDAAAMLVEPCQAYVLYGIEPGLDLPTRRPRVRYCMVPRWSRSVISLVSQPVMSRMSSCLLVYYLRLMGH